MPSFVLHAGHTGRQDGAARYGMEQNGDGLKRNRAVTDCMLFDLCGLTAPSVNQLKSELTILVLSIADQISVWEFEYRKKLSVLCWLSLCGAISSEETLQMNKRKEKLPSRLTAPFYF